MPIASDALGRRSHVVSQFVEKLVPQRVKGPVRHDPRQHRLIIILMLSVHVCARPKRV